MTKRQHTPGPWTIGQVMVFDGQIAIEAGPYTVATAVGGLDEQQANAQLLAAAPTMHDELEFFASLVNPERLAGDHLTDSHRAQLAYAAIDNVIARARAAIAKVTAA